MKKSHSVILALGSLAAASALAVGTSIPANTQKGGYNDIAAQELQAAENAAHSARTAKDLAGVHEHLQAVINCLVGPQGPGYVATTNNPCTHMGRGALTDVIQGSDETRLLNDALSEAKDGLATTNVDDARAKAKEVWGDIDNAQNSAKQ
jgi:hypothetical protein